MNVSEGAETGERMTDPETVSVYNDAARRYADRFAATKDPSYRADEDAFLAFVPSGGRILDLGCGPAEWAAHFRDKGYEVEATDAAEGMADLAQERYGISVRVEPFDALDSESVYDGIWANFSLLHATRAAFPGHLARIHRALRGGGALHLGLKLGRGEGRDHLGRFYTYYGEDELKAMVEEAGFTVTRSRCGKGVGFAGTNDPYIILTAHA